MSSPAPWGPDMPSLFGEVTALIGGQTLSQDPLSPREKEAAKTLGMPPAPSTLVCLILASLQGVLGNQFTLQL